MSKTPSNVANLDIHAITAFLKSADARVVANLTVRVRTLVLDLCKGKLEASKTVAQFELRENVNDRR